MQFIAMETQTAARFRAGESDANGNAPERLVSDGSGYPCRHCLKDVAQGKPLLLFAWRPFTVRHAYAESGPVFVCAQACARFEGETLPPVVAARPAALLRGYDRDERIVEGTGAQLQTEDLLSGIDALFADPRVASVHLRSATNSCFTCKVVA